VLSVRRSLHIGREVDVRGVCDLKIPPLAVGMTSYACSDNLPTMATGKEAQQLEIRRLGKSEIKPTALGLGGGHLGWEHLSERNSIDTIHHAIDLGINFIDTAPAYGLSEERIGKALKGEWRERAYLQTKVGSHPDYLRDWSKEATTWSLENSFKLLRVDYVDSVLIHGPRHDIEAPLDECFGVMKDWKDKGRIGAIGVAVRQPEFHKRAIEEGADIILSFLNYTLVDQTYAEEAIPFAIENDVGVIIGSPLANGLFAGPEPIQTDETRTHGEDGKLVPAAAGSHLDPAAFPPAHAIWKWCIDTDVNIRTLALQFALHAPVKGNGIVLTGASNPTEIEETYNDAITTIPDDVWDTFGAEFGVKV